MGFIDEIMADFAEEETADIALPAHKKEIEECQRKLAENGFPAIPKEYIDFLRKNNGFVWAIHFFGTKPVPNSDPEHTDLRDDLVTANVKFMKYHSDLAHCLLLGKSFNSQYMFDTEKKLYRAWDGNAGIWDDYDSFEELFEEELENV